MDVEQERLARGGELRDDMRDEAVFPERVVVEMPDVRRATEGVGGGLAEGFQQGCGVGISWFGQVAESGDEIMVSANDLVATGEDDMADVSLS